MRRVAVLLALGVVALFAFAGPAAAQSPQRTGSILRLEPPAPMAVGDEGAAVAHLTTSSGAPIAGAAVEFFVQGQRVGRERTDGSGTATAQLRDGLAAGSYQLTAVYDGQPSRRILGSTTQAFLTITPAALTVRTVPPLAGVAFSLALAGAFGQAAGESRVFTSGADGLARIAVTQPGVYRLEVQPWEDTDRGMRAAFSRWSDDFFEAGRAIIIEESEHVDAGFDVSYLVSATLIDRDSEPIDWGRASSMTVLSSVGLRQTMGSAPVWLHGVRVVRGTEGLEEKHVRYAVESVVLDGANIVNRGQQRFFPSENQAWDVQLSLYTAHFKVRDALFGFPLGSAVELRYPDGHTERHKLGANGELTLTSLPRGEYQVKVDGPGMSFTRPVALSRDQDVKLEMISYLDLSLAALLFVVLVVGVLWIGRPQVRPVLRRLPARAIHFVRSEPRLRTLGTQSRRGLVTVGVALRQGALEIRKRTWLGALLLALLASTLPVVSRPATTHAQAQGPTPVLAYYYIWFDATSWNRAKTDYPLIGRYSSDEHQVMRQHVRWAKAAGIEGFVVSWKSEPKLNERLEALMQIAGEEDFKLAIIYQGLDFERRPLPAARVAADLDSFIIRYADHPAFDLYEKPLVIWSGTWEFSPEEVAQVTSTRRERLLLLASERNVAGYERLADFVDGDAYYWSSVNPDTFPGYPEKLAEMSGAVHARRGLWIAPAAPGFDARAIGGTTVVERQDGETLRRQMTAALQSAPDAVGLISWNEFSENSHIEPSLTYGGRYLEVLANMQGAPAPVIENFDSDEPAATRGRNALPLLGALAALLGGLGLAGFLVRHAYRRPADTQPLPPSRA